jgi:transcriptional regulator with XRE-family HTH domain
MRKEKLRSIRTAKGYTQQQIADLIATDVSNYSRKESGDVRITNAEWAKIAHFIDVAVEDIFEEETKVAKKQPLSGKRLSASDTGMISNNISEEVIKTLLEYISLLKEEISELKKKE